MLLFMYLALVMIDAPTSSTSLLLGSLLGDLTQLEVVLSYALVCG